MTVFMAARSLDRSHTSNTASAAKDAAAGVVAPEAVLPPFSLRSFSRSSPLSGADFGLRCSSMTGSLRRRRERAATAAERDPAGGDRTRDEDEEEPEAPVAVAGWGGSVSGERATMRSTVRPALRSASLASSMVRPRRT